MNDRNPGSHHEPRGRVLVVNDDRRLAESVRRLLSDEGYEARCVCDGREAIASLGFWTVDVILLDLIMPTLDGFQFLKHRAANPGLSDAAVVVWSVVPSEDLDRARALGANECLPGATTSPDRLLEVVSDVLVERGAAP